MSEHTEALVLDLVTWLAESPRPYQQVMEAWRTSCPRLPVWEEANDRELVAHRGTMVLPTAKGLALLASRGRKVACTTQIGPARLIP
jgi:hypothetical protein